jgi:hypothetical protein
MAERESQAPNPKQKPNSKSQGLKQPSERSRLLEQAIQANSVSVIWIWSLRIRLGLRISIFGFKCQSAAQSGSVI